MFHAEAYTPVCSTEIIRLSELRKDSGTDLRVLSVIPDKLNRTQNWIAGLNAKSTESVLHDCIADRDGEMALAFGLDKDEMAKGTQRGYFVFDPKLRLRSYTMLPRLVGFSCDELLRVITAICLTDVSGDGAPVDWVPGVKLLRIDA